MSFYLNALPGEQTLATLARSFRVKRSHLERGLELRVFAGRWERRFEEALARFDLGGGRFSVLIHLYCAQNSSENATGLRASELATRMGVTRGNLTGLVASLARDALVSKKTERLDKRSSLIALRPKARKLLARAAPPYFALYEQMLKEMREAGPKL